jgi:hypothetical protein
MWFVILVVRGMETPLVVGWNNGDIHVARFGENEGLTVGRKYKKGGVIARILVLFRLKSDLGEELAVEPSPRRRPRLVSRRPTTNRWSTK